MIAVGAAVEVVDVPIGTPMAGFAARTGPSEGVLDPTTARALALGGALLIAVDVCALHERSCEEVRRRLGSAATSCTVVATHTHAGPACAGGRVGPAHEGLEQAVVDAAVRAGRRALASTVPCTLELARATGLGVVHDRRRGIPADPPLSLLTARDRSGTVIARLAHLACHPVVMDASNRLISGDFPAFLRSALEEADGGTAVFVPGCAGDLNTGHRAEDSYRADGGAARSPQEARRIGELLAARALTAPAEELTAASGQEVVGARSRDVGLELAVPSPAQIREDRSRWVARRPGAPAPEAHLLDIWIAWADAALGDPAPGRTWQGRVTALRIGPLLLVTLPGEPFLRSAERIEEGIRAATGPGARIIVLGCADGVPGYLPPAEAYPEGGYEVADAHRYYAMPGPFAAGSAERLERTAVAIGVELLEESR
ncbi:hypothetical protein [Brachybacterium hainanense]|uniref:Alkaline ceramidase n=1 Tax=Brachybacterium hainanense TaxID=1541174 RepID=A0ABV6RCB4_9MICO